MTLPVPLQPQLLRKPRQPFTNKRPSLRLWLPLGNIRGNDLTMLLCRDARAVKMVSSTGAAGTLARAPAQTKTTNRGTQNTISKARAGLTTNSILFSLREFNIFDPISGKILFSIFTSRNSFITNSDPWKYVFLSRHSTCQGPSNWPTQCSLPLERQRYKVSYTVRRVEPQAALFSFN